MAVDMWQWQLVRADGTVLLDQMLPAGATYQPREQIDGDCTEYGRALPDGDWVPLVRYRDGYPGSGEPAR